MANRARKRGARSRASSRDEAPAPVARPRAEGESPAFTAALVGRPNVGKSTLFNRLVGQRLALVDDRPGVTRDRREGTARLLDLTFTVFDTAGLEAVAGTGSLEARMRAQTDAALARADIVLFLVDARAGVTAADEAFADELRRLEIPVLLVANKAEGRAGEAGFVEAHALGLGEPVPISAEHGEGMVDLYDAIVEALGTERARGAVGDGGIEPGGAPSPAPGGDDSREEGVGDASSEAIGAGPLRIAVAGRPNAGKSTLVNRLLGEERLLTGPEAGLTRDSIAVDFSWGHRAVRMHDTAGLRRRGKVGEKLEKLSVGDALRAIRFAEIVILVLDATRPFEAQDLRIADLVAEEGRGIVVALNKWDLVEERQDRLTEAREAAERLLPQLRGLRLVPVSAETGEGVDRLMREVFGTHATWGRRVPTARLNDWLEGATARHAPPAVSGRRVRLKYATQIKGRPPTFMVSTTRPDAVGEAYTRYLVNGLREAFDLWGVPVRLNYRAAGNPYEPVRKRAQVPKAKPGRQGKAAANAEKKARRGLGAKGRRTASGKPRAGSTTRGDR